MRTSEIKLFKRCQRHWYLAYVRDGGLELIPSDRPTDGETPPVADTGTEVHRMLQEYYSGKVPGSGPITDSENELAQIMFDGYLEWIDEEGADVGLTVLDVETQIEAEIAGVTVTGRQDLVVHDDAFDATFLMDHKTVQSLDQYGEQLKVDDQLLTYCLLRKLNGLPTAGAIHNMLRRVKRTARATPPFYGRRQVVFNDTQLRNHYRHLVQTIEALKAQESIAAVGDNYIPGLSVPTPNQNCTWDCPFLGVCPMMDDGSDWVGMLAANYRPRTNV